MSRSFVGNLSVIVILNILVKPAYILGIEVAVQNAVGVTAFGLYFALLNSTYLLQIFNDFGLQIYNNRQVALNASQIASAFRSFLKIKALLAVVFLFGIYFLSFLLGYEMHLRLLLLIGVNLILMSFVLFLRSNISGLGFYKTDSSLSVIDKGLMILICGYLLLFHFESFTIFHFVLAQTASLFIAALIALLILTKKSSVSSPGQESVRPSELMKKAAPYALAVFLMTIYTRVDAVMIEQIAVDGAYQSGLYAAGYRLLDAANMFAYLFTVLLLPMFTKLLAQRSELLRLMQQSSRIMWFTTVSVVVICITLRHDIIDYFYTEATIEWSDTFGILIASFVPVGLMYVFGTYMVAGNHIRRLNYLYASCVAINVILNAVLIPNYGAKGAAIATLATQGVVAIVLLILTARYLSVQPAPKLLVAMATFTLILVVTTLLLSRIESLGWFITLLISAVAATIIAFATGLIRKTDFQHGISE